MPKMKTLSEWMAAISTQVREEACLSEIESVLPWAQGLISSIVHREGQQCYEVQSIAMRDVEHMIEFAQAEPILIYTIEKLDFSKLNKFILRYVRPCGKYA